MPTLAELEKEPWAFLIAPDGTVKFQVSTCSTQIGFESDPRDLRTTGMLYASNGVSGSHSKLADGTSLMAAGANITIATGSTGQITISASGGSGSPGGSDTQIQYNNGGSFGGVSKLTWDDTDFMIGAAAATKLQIRDSGIFINSSEDGELNLSADGIMEDAIKLSAANGGIDLSANSSKDITIGAGQIALTSGHNTANSIYLRANAGISETIKIHADQGTGVSSIYALSDVGGIKLESGLDNAASINLIGYGMTFTGGDNNDSFYFENSAIKLEQISAPSITTDKLYNVGGSLTWNGAAIGSDGSGNYSTKTSNFTVSATNYILGVNTHASATSITGTLQAAATAGAGRQIIFKDIGGMAGIPGRGVHIATNGSEKINDADAANILVTSGSMSLVSDGSNWFIFGIS